MIKIFEKLFHKEKRAPLPVSIETAPLSEEQIKTVAVATATIKPPQLVAGSAQSVGLQRDHNEDALFSLTALLSDENTELPFGIFIVADGMGGHQHGEVASGIAARTMAEYLLKHLYSPLMGARNETPGESLQEIMENGVNEAHQLVLRRAPGGGTTLTAALVIGEQVILAHVGDSRAYFVYPDGRVQAITQDHSLVKRLVQLGQLTDDEAAIHPQRNVLYRAIGQSEPFRPDINNHQFPHPGYLLLCSDGLWGVVSEDEIHRIVTSAPNLTVACQELVKAANTAGGPDNISAILVEYVC